MDDPAGQLVEVLDALRAIAAELTAEDAAEELDAATLQLFWREWPGVSAWAGALWRRLNEDLELPAQPPEDHEMRELGGSG